MNPQWILVALALLQVAGIALLWRIQRDQARQAERLKEWVHAEYLPRELAEARYLRKPELSGFSAISEPKRANS